MSSVRPAPGPRRPADHEEQVRRQARLVARVGAGAGLGALAAIPFLLIMVLVISEAETLAEIDRTVANALNQWALSLPRLVTVLEVVERATSPWAFRIAVLIAAGLLWRAGSRRLATWAVTTMAVGGLLNVVVKGLVQRARPAFPEPAATADFYSFPSGHAQNSMLGVAVLLLIVLPLVGRRGTAVTWSIGALLVLLTGFDRVALGVHYVSDVVAGWVLALALVVGTTVAFDAHRARRALAQGVDPVSSRRLVTGGDTGATAGVDRGNIRGLLAELRSLVGRLMLATAAICGVLVVMGWAITSLDEAVWPLTREEGWVQWLAQHRTPTWNEITHWMSWIADTVRIEISMVIVAIGFRFTYGRWRESAFVVAAVTMQAVAFVLTTAVIARSRPEVEHLESSPPTSSFPSGHAGAALALYGSIALVLAWHTRRTWLRALIWALLMMPPLAVGFSRLYRGVHFPSDLVGSVVDAGLSITVAGRLLLFAALPPQLLDVLDTSFRRRGAPIGPEPAPATTKGQEDIRLAALVVNPTKVGDATVETVRRHCAARGWAEPLVLKTTRADPGTSMSRHAVNAGVDLVLSCGGDGTVAAVATGLAGTGVPLGVLPCGTGNLLSRNLGLPGGLEEALEVALTGSARPLDLGAVGDRRFAVMAGVGFDALMMADASSDLKRRLGWPAYALAGARHLRDRRIHVELRLDHRPPLTRRVRTVLVGNVGHLEGGLPLLPGADPGDGVLDVVVVAPRTLPDWALVAWRVIGRRGREDRRLERFRARHVELRTDRAVARQLDGEPIGRDRSLVVEVHPGSLKVMVAT